MINSFLSIKHCRERNELLTIIMEDCAKVVNQVAFVANMDACD
jgi:hypothetical protein